MTNFDIVGALRAYAVANDWVFLAGVNAYQNYSASQQEYKNSQLILGANLSAAPRIVNGKVIEITYSGLIFLGQKFDDDGTPAIPDNPETPEDETETFNDGTPANLDETFIQKYDRRLLNLMSLLTNHLGTFACSNELEISNFNIDIEINKYDANLDFVGGSITLIQ